MKKIIEEVDKEKGIKRVTTVDERWYIKETTDQKTGLPSLKYVPSVTWIAESYPKGIGFYKWLADKSWDEAEALKVAAGEKGSRVHQAIHELISGKEVRIDSKYTIDGEESELSLEDYDCIISFARWAAESKPTFIKTEYVVFNDELNYAGTVDLLCEIGGEKYIVDFKTSQYIWPSHKLQLSAYKKCGGDVKLAILQVGYRLNKKKYKFTEIDDCFDLFMSARNIWESENKGVEPKQKDYPLSIKL